MRNATANEEARMVDKLNKEQLVKLGLPKNRNKLHWAETTSFFLFQRLVEEVEELREAVYNQDNVWEEAADVANFAAMIAENNA